MKWILVFFVSGLLVTCEAARIKRQFSFDYDEILPNTGDQFGNQFFSNRYPQFNRPNQGFNNQGFNQPNQGFGNQGSGNQGFPNQGFNNNNQGFNQQRPNQGFNNNNQGFNNNQQTPNQGFNGNNNQQQTTRAPVQTTRATTLAPAIQTCVDACPGRTTSEYNPVCGSDNQTYSNPARLLCAQDCGASVSNSRPGACRTT